MPEDAELKRESLLVGGQSTINNLEIPHIF